jgi:hypothetical protein
MAEQKVEPQTSYFLSYYVLPTAYSKRQEHWNTLGKGGPLQAFWWFVLSFFFFFFNFGNNTRVWTLLLGNCSFFELFFFFFFWLGYFLDRVCVFLPQASLRTDASSLVVNWDGVFPNFLLGLVLNHSLMITNSQLTGIIKSYHAWPFFFLKKWKRVFLF